MQDLAVGGLLYIELDEVAVLLGRKTKGCQRVFRGCRRRTSMRDDQRRLLATVGQEREQANADGGEQRDGSDPHHCAHGKSTLTGGSVLRHRRRGRLWRADAQVQARDE